jgi:hypothetical protein
MEAKAVEQKQQRPAYVVALLAILGLIALPRVATFSDGPRSTISGAGAAPASHPIASIEDEGDEPDRADLKPLIEYLSTGKEDDASRVCLKQFFGERLPALGERDRSVHILLITMPDPIRSAASTRFDEFLDIFQRAIELQGFLLDRSRLPWSAESGEASKSNDTTGSAKLRLKLTVEVPGHGSRKQGRSPGLIVFKEAFPRKGQDPALVLGFLIPESPITGIDKHAFLRALELRRTYFSEPPNADAIVRVIGPCFSASQRSLEVLLRTWAKEAGDRPSHMRILSNNAGLVKKERLEQAVLAEGSRHTVSFRAMVHETEIVAATTLDYLKKRLGYSPGDIALLIESNSGMAQALANKWKSQNLADEFIFPVQVAELRKEYERKGLLEPGKVDATAAADRLRIPPDEAGAPRDMPHSFTPAGSAALDELALNQVLTTIGRRRYNVVGIIATGPQDIVFLAERVRRFCPSVRLFTTHADLLFARSQNAEDLRGMLVASTYSLYAGNQWITAPHLGTPHIPFSDQAGQGLYNAVVAHLWEMRLVRDDAGRPSSHPPLLEFRNPYENSRDAATDFRPPIWISSVGERGIFPITVWAPKLPPSEHRDALAADRAYLYDFTQVPDANGKMTALFADSGPMPTFGKSGRPSAHPLYSVICLALCVLCLLTAALTVVYVRWSVDPEKNTRLNANVWPFKFGHLVRMFNIEVDVGHRGAYDPQKKYADEQVAPFPPRIGGGIYPLLMNLLVLGLSYYTFSFVAPAHPLQLELGTSAAAADAKAGATKDGTGDAPAAVGDAAERHAAEPSIRTKIRPIVVFAILVLFVVPSLSLIGASTVLALLEFLGQLPIALPGKADRFLLRHRRWLFIGIAVGSFAGWCWFLQSDTDPVRTIDLDRVSNLPSGLSPIFPVAFLGAGLAALIHAQLTRRALYRKAYLPFKQPRKDEEEPKSQSARILKLMRERRTEVDKLLRSPWIAAPQLNRPWILAPIVVSGLFFFIRASTRGIARSFEGYGFDVAMAVLGLILVGFIVGHIVLLVALWDAIRDLLRLAVLLPIAGAFNRIPHRLKGWFFEAEHIEWRTRLIHQQAVALRSRTTNELAAALQVLAPRPTGEWEQEVSTATNNEWDDASLDWTRMAVNPFLLPLWDSFPVEEARASTPALERADVRVDWLESWPVMPADLAKLTEREHAIIRDWTRIAEDLVVLQIVRWFAPPLAQALSIMRFLVLGTLFLILATMSYPFDHQGLLMTATTIVLACVAWVVATVLIGANRDELISRVSDTTPGRLSFDFDFLSSLLTFVVPLLGALLAMSYDLTDLLRTWFGPFSQYF